ncbi:MAG: hypothetical protein HC851_21520 [Acaryochloris sp. RU_4_1]|nr:hypothetical protein [Acaryochloris sp. RU_4_1]NJR56622.1 hypothetical protein [Acaryochloris sp. CRU_2_0]
MNTLDDILEILKTSHEKLNEMLEACGWTGLTEFTDEQADTLLSIQAIHEANTETSYLNAFLRTIGQKLEVDKTQFNEIYKAINAAGGGLIDYRDRFEEICQQVNDGVSPDQAILPPQPVVEDAPPVVDPQAVQMDTFITAQAQAAIAITIAQIEGFADLAYEEQERLKNLFMTKYREGLAKELLSPGFKAQFMARMNASLGQGEKKPGELTGATMPPPLLSSSN